MSEHQPGQEPTYGEETDQQPHYPADGGTDEDETGRAGSDPAAQDGGGQGTSDGLGNPDLHGAAREVAEGASGDGAAKTPGA